MYSSSPFWSSTAHCGSRISNFIALFMVLLYTKIMSYSSIPNFDVSVLQTPKGVACVMCSFGDFIEVNFLSESTQEMVDHLLAHQRKGDLVPETIYDDLWRDDRINYPGR